jgi:hypothetical protein
MSLTDAIALPFAPETRDGSEHLPVGPVSEAWRRFDVLVVLVFLAGLLVPGGLLLAGRHAAAVENRPLLRMPPFSAAAALDGTYTAGVDAYLADNVAVRPYAIRLRGEAEWLSGGTGNPEVLRGRDGWLFTAFEFAPVCRLPLDGQLAALRAAAQRFTQSGQTFRYVGVPDKHAIYPDKVLANPLPAACNELGRDEVRATLGAIAPAGIDGWSVLDAARAADPTGPPLYYPLDSHWTPTGAAAVVGALVRSIDPGLWDDADVATAKGRSRSDLASQMGIHRADPQPGVVLRPGMAVRRTDLAIPVEIHNARAVFRTTASGSRPVVPGRTVIVYDSFFGIDVSLLAPYFADVTWIHVGDLQAQPELAAMLGPFDTVVVERVDRGFYDTDLGPVLDRLVR